MRITYRTTNNKDYWTKRWENISADQPMTNLDVYPLKYAEMTIDSKKGKILEAGCGAGRVLRYYKERDYDIIGMDFIINAIEKLKHVDSSLNVEVGDITDMKYNDHFFRYVLAFGLYHNLQIDKVKKAIKETYRVLEYGGKVCASFRADNIQTKLSDWLIDYRHKGKGLTAGKKEFHKLNLTKNEFTDLFDNNNFIVEKIFPVENMPFLYKFRFFRASLHKTFNENLAREEGYKLSVLGTLLQRFFMCFFPYQFCNVFVIIAKKY
jgi:ubiquinone/menaquinone biosynthesis C-methylase UbiE